MSFKIGDRVKRINSSWNNVNLGQTYIVKSFCDIDGLTLADTDGDEVSGLYDDAFFETQKETTPNYAAAFNMWMNDFVNAPQAYEDSHSIAIRHLTEKLNGEEPSYGMICEQVLIEYLEKVK